jgi:hypothetical protein
MMGIRVVLRQCGGLPDMVLVVERTRNEPDEQKNSHETVNFALMVVKA